MGQLFEKLLAASAVRSSQTWSHFCLSSSWQELPPPLTYLFLEQPGLHPDLQLKLSGIPNSWLPLLLEERRGPCLFPERPDLSLDLLLKLSGTNNNFQPLLLVERRGLSLFPEPFPDLFLDLLLKPNGTNRTWPPSLILPPLDPFPSLEPPV